MEVGREVVRLGAMTPLRELARSRELPAICPSLVKAAGQAGAGAKAGATVGGALCEAPSGCSLAPALMVHDAWVELADRRSKRQVGLEYFFMAPGLTSRTPGEVMLAVCFGRPHAGQVSGFTRRAGALGQVSVAGSLSLRDGLFDGVRLAAAGAGPTPLRLEPVEELLEGARPSADLLREAGHMASGCAVRAGATRASAAFRRRILGEQARGLLSSLVHCRARP